MRRLLLTLSGVLFLTAVVATQPLSNQVLQLLTRLNTWTVLQTYNAGIKFARAVPSVTTDTIYAAANGDLYYAGTPISAGAAALTPHNIFSTSHADSVAGAAVRGGLMYGNATPAWDRLTVGAAGRFLRSDGTDVSWGVDGSSLTNLPAANITGTLPAISGVNLTALNATQLTSGTVPLARLVGITNAEIAAGAAIAYSKLNLASSINLSTDTAATALPFAKGGTGLTTAVDDTTVVSSGAAWVATALPDCDASTSALNYDVTTNAFSCRTLSLGTGTVTSAALSLPAIFSVAGSPITTTGTFTVTLASQAQNLVWASPNGSAGAPTFRALVNADLPTSGVAAASYSSVTVNDRGIITAASANQSLTTVSGTLGIANGGTGLTSIGDDNIFLGSAATTAAAAAIPNCVAASCWGLGYTTATNTFAAISARTLTYTEWLDPGYCQNITAVLEWSTPTTNPGVAACVTGTNTQKLVVDFADGANTLSLQKQYRLPDDWTGALDVDIWWYTTAITGSVVWQIATICVGNTETGDPAFNTASAVIDAAHGTTNQYNVATITGVTATGCAAGEVLYLRFFRDPTHANDDLAATARFVGVELTYRRSL